MVRTASTEALGRGGGCGRARLLQSSAAVYLDEDDTICCALRQHKLEQGLDVETGIDIWSRRG